MSTRQLAKIEQERLEIQAALDSARSFAQRNKLGQFATPPGLALSVLRLARSLLPPRCAVRFLDPAFGTGAFYSALLQSFPKSRIEWSKGVEIDPHYGQPACELWNHTPLSLSLCDFTKIAPPVAEDEKATLIVCNPPYVRHHHLQTSEKQRLRALSMGAAGVDLNGLAGLYCHFVALSHAWMARNALAIWLIPSEFMDVNYGRALKHYLLGRVTLLRIHRFDPAEVQFDDALVSSAIVAFRNTTSSAEHRVQFTYGGTLAEPEQQRAIPAGRLRPENKWSGLPVASGDHHEQSGRPRLGQLFSIKRGLATGSNGFFIMPESKARDLGLPRRFLRPILPSPRFLHTDEVGADKNGWPLVEPRLVLLDCRLPEATVCEECPELWAYLQSGRTDRIHERYLCTHREPWYSQEDRAPAPILCTYMGRSGNGKTAFRFVLNHSKAIAANVYLMLYPKGALARLLPENTNLLRSVWSALSQIPWAALRDVGRIYGGGLHKLEPKELAAAPAETVLGSLPDRAISQARQLTLSW